MRLAVALFALGFGGLTEAHLGVQLSKLREGVHRTFIMTMIRAFGHLSVDRDKYLSGQLFSHFETSFATAVGAGVTEGD